MSVSEVSVPLWGRDAARCNHLRQRHPLHRKALLVCPWPECPEGTRNGVIEVPVASDFGSAPVLVRFERQSLPQGPGLAFRWMSAP